MSLKILKPGILTTIQDTGRYGHQKEGVVVGGAMDTVALRLANLLVGNEESDAAIEATLTGPHITFIEDHLIAITGADMTPTIDGTTVKMWRPVYVKKGSTLKFGAPGIGSRTYIAVSGSFAIPKVMGSYGTFLRAGVGGFQGRPLQAGDELSCNAAPAKVQPLLEELRLLAGDNSFSQAKWSVDSQIYPDYQENPIIRLQKGPEYHLLSELSRFYLWKEKFQVMAQSDRMGYHLLGVTLSLTDKKELISTAVTFGTIQIPPKGSLIVLMADRQTTGGYPRVAQVISVDLPRLAQVQPGKIIRFSEASLEEAQQLYMQQEDNIEQFKRGLNLKFR